MTSVYESKVRQSKIVYDKEAGLSYEIEKAFQSPVKRSNNSSLRSSPDPNQCCCSCMELIGGRLYTCARCNSSFHSICHFPALPINTGKAKNADWMCHRCKFEAQYQRPQHRLKCSPDPQEREDALNQSFVRFLLRLDGKDGNPSERFGDFVSALKCINAREFSLESLDVDEIYYKLPFDELFSREAPSSSAKCFYCRRYVEKQMIACDFCGTTFCFDCPNPPLTAQPNVRWMCALHIEPFLDTYLLSSMRITDRIALWQEHTQLPEAGHRSVLEDFCRKLKEEDAKMPEVGQSERRKRGRPRKETFKVDRLVKDAYSRARDRSSAIGIEQNRMEDAKMPEVEQSERRKLGRPMKETFKVDRLVKEAYSRARNRAIEQNRMKAEECVASSSKSPAEDDPLTTAAEALLSLQNQTEPTDERIDVGSPCIPVGEEAEFTFNPKLLNKDLPVFAALRILRGADKPTSDSHYLIPIQALFITLGPFESSSLHRIDLSQFTTCKMLANQQALIFFDKGKLCFEMVAANLFIDEFEQLFDLPKSDQGLGSSTLCACQRAPDDPLRALFDPNNGIVVPLPNKSTTLWNGAIIRIGCLHLHFVGLGIL